MATLGIPQNTIEVLEKYNFNFQKKFGQNFLIDTHVLEKIIEESGITKDDFVLEIGPGIGTMTQYLCENAREVAAVEIDKNLIPILADTLSAYDNVEVINDDILKVDIASLAKEKNVNFMFEASVGGGIPIIRPLNSCLTADEIEEITGIVNGTTNYMMTEMTEKGADFNEVLKDAQAKGYAEKDPTADVEGYDACRKIAILTSLVCGQQVDFEDIHTEGITKITPTDIKYAQAMGRAIKLLATSKKGPKGYTAIVAPFLLPASHPLYAVNGVFNAIFVHGNVLGDAMFYGSGAGKLPTASAVVADVVEMAKNLDKNIPIEWSSKKLELVDYREWENRFFIRTTADKAAVERVFGTVTYVQAEGVTGELGFVTEKISESDCEKKEAELGNVLQKIRVA